MGIFNKGYEYFATVGSDHKVWLFSFFKFHGELKGTVIGVHQIGPAAYHGPPGGGVKISSLKDGNGTSLPIEGKSLNRGVVVHVGKNKTTEKAVCVVTDVWMWVR